MILQSRYLGPTFGHWSTSTTQPAA